MARLKDTTIKGTLNSTGLIIGNNGLAINNGESYFSNNLRIGRTFSRPYFY